MKHPYFRNIILSGLIGGLIISVYLVALSLLYKNPLNSTPKTLDILFYVIIPVASVFYFKTKINQGQLKFLEGMVNVSLVNAMMVTFACVTLAIMLQLKPSILQNDIDQRIKGLNANKKEVLKKLEGSGLTFEALIQKTKEKPAGIVILQELGIKMIVGLFTSMVVATALRSKGDFG